MRRLLRNIRNYILCYCPYYGDCNLTDPFGYYCKNEWDYCGEFKNKEKK